MSNIVIEWDNPEQTVVRLTLHEGWSWSELYEANKSIIDMMKSTDQTVHLLLDTTQINSVPMGGVITNARNILGAYPPNCDMRILITRNLLIQPSRQHLPDNLPHRFRQTSAYRLVG